MSNLAEVQFLDPKSPPHILTLTLMAGLAALSMNVFLPSLPEMAEHFGTDYRFMQLSVAIYLAMNAGLQILLGPISDRFGRRPVLLGSFAVYVVATVGCIYAPNITVFLAFRMMQAFVVTGMVLSRAVIRDMVPGDKAASLIAYVTMGMSLVPMISPALGGYMGEAFGWQSTFWLQVALGILVLAMMVRDLGETHPRGEGSLMDQVRAYPFLLRSRRFWGYSLAAMFSSGTFFAYLGGAPFVGNEMYHLSSGTLGLLFGAPGVGYLVGNWITGRFAVAIGMNRLILIGCLVVTAGLIVSLLLQYAGFGSAYQFFGFMTFVGLGNGMVLPNANAGMLSVRPQLAGSASGLGGAMMIGGGAAISAFVGTVLTVESGPTPMLWLMVVSSSLSVAAILLVIRRERQLGGLA